MMTALTGVRSGVNDDGGGANGVSGGVSDRPEAGDAKAAITGAGSSKRRRMESGSRIGYVIDAEMATTDYTVLWRR